MQNFKWPPMQEGIARFTTVPWTPLCVRQVQKYMYINFSMPACLLLSCVHSTALCANWTINLAYTRICSWTQAGFDAFTHIYLCTQTTQRCKGYCCKSGIVLFAWRVTWNYDFSPFKLLLGWRYLILILINIYNCTIVNRCLILKHFC